MNTIDKLAQKVQDNMGPQQVVLDPATVTIITTIIVESFKLLKACVETPEQAVQVAYNPVQNDIKKLKAVIRKQLGWWRNLWEGAKYLEAILKTGTQLTVADVKKSFKDISETTVEYAA